MTKPVTTLAMTFLVLCLAGCDEDSGVYLSTKDWKCTATQPHQERVCERGAIDLKFGREGKCHYETEQECTQWTRQ